MVFRAAALRWGIYYTDRVGCYCLLLGVAVGRHHRIPDISNVDSKDLANFDERLAVDPLVSVFRHSGFRIRAHVVRFHPLDGLFAFESNKKTELFLSVMRCLAGITNTVRESEMESVNVISKLNITLFHFGIFLFALFGFGILRIVGVHKTSIASRTPIAMEVQNLYSVGRGAAAIVVTRLRLPFFTWLVNFGAATRLQGGEEKQPDRKKTARPHR